MEKENLIVLDLSTMENADKIISNLNNVVEVGNGIFNAIKEFGVAYIVDDILVAVLPKGRKIGKFEAIGRIAAGIGIQAMARKLVKTPVPFKFVLAENEEESEEDEVPEAEEVVDVEADDLA